MMASDIGGVGGPAATPAPGPSPQRHSLPFLAAQPPGIGGDGGVGGSGERGRRCVCGWVGGDEGVGYWWCGRAGSDSGSRPVAAAAPAPAVGCAAAGYRRWQWRRREQGEGKEKRGEGNEVVVVGDEGV